MRLIKGNCLDILPTLEADSVRLFIIDLPYGQTNYEWDKTIDLEKLWKELKRVGKENACYAFFTTTKYGIDIINSNRRWFRYDLVVHKSNVVGFFNCKRMPMRSHEMIYIFYNKLPVYNIDKYHKVESTREWNTETREYLGARRENVPKKKYTPPLPSSIWRMKNEVNQHRQRNHPTEKTQDILTELIKYYSDEGETVCDPTMGSGSTGVACQALGREFIGIELDEGYYRKACERNNFEAVQKN